MSYEYLHDLPYPLVFRQGVAANINILATRNFAMLGMPHYTNDTFKFYIFDGTVNKRVHVLDMILSNVREVIVNSGEVEWTAEY